MQLANARSIQFCGAMLFVAGANCVKDLVEQQRLLLRAKNMSRNSRTDSEYKTNQLARSLTNAFRQSCDRSR